MRSYRLIVSMILFQFSFSIVAADLELIKQKAAVVAEATKAGDWEKVIDCTYPKVVEKSGGREKMLDLLKTFGEQAKKSGFVFLSTIVEAPSEVVGTGLDLAAIVPVVVRVRMQQGTATVKSYLVGISNDGGKTWTFIDGSALAPDDFAELVPESLRKIKLPEREEPKIEKAHE